MTYEEKIRLYIKLCEEDLIIWKKENNRVAYESIKSKLQAYKVCLDTFLDSQKSE